MNKRPYFNRTAVLNVMIHIIVLCIVFILPDVFFSMSRGSRAIEYRHLSIYSHTLIFIITFYINYFLFIDRLLFRRKVLLYIATALLFALAMTVVEQFVHKGLMMLSGEMPPKRRGPEMNGFFFLGLMSRDYVMLILTTGLSVALKMGLRWANIEKMKERMLSEQREMELKNLKNQLNPHFLFNTLNNIYALTAIDSEKAQNAIHQLSKMLRYTLYENEDKEVTLEKELRFIESYIELMKLRLSEHNKLTVGIYNGPTNSLTIAPMMFIPLIENAFKHGGSGSKPSLIVVRISLDGTTVCCHVENSNFPKKDSDKSGSGIGLTNLSRQLSLLYDGRHSYSATIIGDRYVAELSITLSNPQQQRK